MNLKEIVQHCESPIETMLALAIADRFSDLEDAGMILTPLPPMEYESYERLPAEGLAFLIPQAVVDGADLRHYWRYRVDFLLVCGADPMFRRVFSIECDGHEWHEKTKKQVARDKLRDRRLILDNITPIRFSGSEIHRDAAGCADYIRDLANSAVGDVLGEQNTWNELKAMRPSPGYRGPGVGR